MIRIKKKIIFIILFVLVAMIGSRQIIHANNNIYNKWMLLTLIVDKIERFYVDEKDFDELLVYAIEGILSRLDPHSTYLTAQEYRDWKQKYETYNGIGLKYCRDSEGLWVTSLLEKGPARAAGIVVGDLITEIQGIKVQGMSQDIIQSFMTHSTRPSLTLTIKNRPQNPVKINRKPIHRASITCGFLLGEKTGYIKINFFSETTGPELDEIFSNLDKAGAQQYLLDLRDNKGGVLQSGVSVADRFLDGNKLIVSTKGRTLNATKTFISSDGDTYPPFPLIVLVDSTTASDAEIVAGALQDWDRALIVGRDTFGKAFVQSEFTFQDGSALLLSTARYYTPLGRCLQKDTLHMNPKPFRTPKGRMVYGGTGGIAPDIKLDKPDQKTNKAMSKLLQSHQNVFFRFAIQYIDSMPNKPNTIQQLVVTDKLFLDLKNYLLKMNTAQSVQILKYPDEVIKKALGTELAGYLAGDLGRYHFNLREDPDVISAVQYFQQAKRLLTLQVH